LSDLLTANYLPFSQSLCQSAILHDTAHEQCLAIY